MICYLRYQKSSRKVPKPYNSWQVIEKKNEGLNNKRKVIHSGKIDFARNIENK